MKVRCNNHLAAAVASLTLAYRINYSIVDTFKVSWVLNPSGLAAVKTNFLIYFLILRSSRYLTIYLIKKNLLFTILHFICFILYMLGLCSAWCSLKFS